MIKGILLINNSGKPRLVKFYDRIEFEKQQTLINEIYSLVSRRPGGGTVCEFVDYANWPGRDTRIIYRHYATLYFIFVVDSSESELGILDLIQVFVEALDRSFENVCELDLIFHSDRVHYILDEIVVGGMVLETSKDEVLKSFQNMQRTTATARSARLRA